MEKEYYVNEDNICDVLSSILADEKITQTELSEQLRYRSRQAVNNKLTKKRLTRIDKLVKLLHKLEYDLIIRKMEHPF